MTDDLAAWLTQIWDELEKALLSNVQMFAVSRPELARIAADRQILAFVQRVQKYAGDPPGWDSDDADALWHVVRLLAVPYADRAGYREEWRPASPSQPESEPLP